MKQAVACEACECPGIQSRVAELDMHSCDGGGAMKLASICGLITLHGPEWQITRAYHAAMQPLRLVCAWADPLCMGTIAFIRATRLKPGQIWSLDAGSAACHSDGRNASRAPAPVPVLCSFLTGLVSSRATLHHQQSLLDACKEPKHMRLLSHKISDQLLLSTHAACPGYAGRSEDLRMRS